MVEQSAVNRSAMSSNLIITSIKCRVRLAGLGHLPFTEKVTGSNPVRDTKWCR
jgi:hypothetical protein